METTRIEVLNYVTLYRKILQNESENQFRERQIHCLKPSVNGNLVDSKIVPAMTEVWRLLRQHCRSLRVFSR